MSIQLLNITVNCKGNEQCLFNGEDLFIDIIITNKHKSAIGYPLEFIRTSGPSIRLIDTHTRKESYVPIGPPDPDLQKKFTMIQPGKSLTLEWVIGRNSLKQLGGPYVDVSAEITLADIILVDGKYVHFDGSDTIHIVSKDKR
jgi:hypothetical protein